MLVSLAVSDFVGRAAYLAKLQAQLDEVRETGAARFVAMRGRRRVGKSRLAQEFIEQAGLPYVFYQAPKGVSLAQAAELLTVAIGASTLPAAELVRDGTSFQTFTAALDLIAGQATPETPAIVVIDEFPYLVERHGQAIEAELQAIYDRRLDGRGPVLLIIVGSDLSMMESLAEYGRPLHGRPTKELVIAPFSPDEVGQLLGLEAVDALDAYLIAGGFPLVSRSWCRGMTIGDFLGEALDDPTAPLIVDAERMLRSEFPADTQARGVLSSIGSGESSFTDIGRRAGIQATPLKRSLDILLAKRVLVARRPLSLTLSRETRYAVADPYLRFWLRYIEPSLDEIERGRGAIVAEAILADWQTYSGIAVEPVIREALTRTLPDPRYGAARDVGGWWNRTNSVEVDLVGVDRADKPRAVGFVGSIKWRRDAPFDRGDTNALVNARQHVAGAETARLAGVSRTGFRRAALDIELGPDDIVAAWSVPASVRAQ